MKCEYIYKFICFVREIQHKHESESEENTKERLPKTGNVRIRKTEREREPSCYYNI